jgi:hypothetical protein
MLLCAQGCDPVDIMMVRRDGRLSGEAFIVLSSPMHVELALSKNRTYLGRRYIEVYRAKKLVGCGEVADRTECWICVFR